jgi:hypothetical protein
VLSVELVAAERRGGPHLVRDPISCTSVGLITPVATDLDHGANESLDATVVIAAAPVLVHEFKLNEESEAIPDLGRAGVALDLPDYVAEVSGVCGGFFVGHRLVLSMAVSYSGVDHELDVLPPPVVGEPELICAR